VIREEESRKQSAKAAEDARLQEAETLWRRLEEMASKVDEFQKQQTSVLETCEWSRRTVARLPDFTVKSKEDMDDFMNQYREERRKYNENLCVLFPRAAAQPVETRDKSISEARHFALDVRLDAMEEQVGRLSAEKAELQAHVSALRHSSTSSTQPEGITSGSGSRGTSTRKLAPADCQITVPTNGAAAQQPDETDCQQSTFNDSCILGSQVIPGRRNRPRSAREMQRNPAALAFADVSEQLLEQSSSSGSCNKRRPRSAACRAAVLRPSQRQSEVDTEPSLSLSRSPSVQHGNDFERAQYVLNLHPESIVHGSMERAANSVHEHSILATGSFGGQVLAAPTSDKRDSLHQDCSLPAKVRRDRSGMRAPKAATLAAMVCRPHSAKAHSIGPGNHRGHVTNMSPN